MLLRCVVYIHLLYGEGQGKLHSQIQGVARRLGVDKTLLGFVCYIQMVNTGRGAQVGGCARE